MGREALSGHLSTMRRSFQCLAPVSLLVALAACAPQSDEDEDSGATMPDIPAAQVTAPSPPASEGEDADTSEATTGRSPFVAETGWLTISRSGAVQTTFFDADGTYRDYRDGKAVGAGTWERGADGAVCFMPEAAPETCWTMRSQDEEGEVTATGPDGRTIAIRRIAYRPDPVDEEEPGAQDS
jgi:hypothetical protein